VWSCGFDVRPQLNGQTGQLLGFHAAHSRWLVSLDDGAKKLILTTNLQPEALSASSKAIDADSRGAVPVKSEAGGNSPVSGVIAAVSPTDHLQAHLASERSQALHRIAEVCGKSCEEISQLRSHVQESCCGHQQRFFKYCEMQKPTTWSQQRERNSERQELRRVGQSVLTSMQQLFGAPLKPMAALREAEAEWLEKIDAAIDMLTSLRAETVTSFAEYAAKLEVDRWATETAIKSLAPSMETVNKFMQCFSQEVQREKAEAERMNQELLEKLQKEEAALIDGWCTPALNPLFAKVEDEISALKRRIEERASSDASHMSLMQSWDSLVNVMASKQQLDNVDILEPEPSRRSFWSHLKCSMRAVPASS